MIKVTGAHPTAACAAYAAAVPGRRRTHGTVEFQASAFPTHQDKVPETPAA